MNFRSALEARYPFSLSRWTDLPVAKWEWFLESLKRGYMVGFDPASGVPARWSLSPVDTLGLLFWTKDPTNLIKTPMNAKGFKVKVHVTATGWHEVETGAPSLSTSANLLKLTAATYGPENVYWRFSPIPLVSDVISRFEFLAYHASEAKLDRVYLSFLQTNDLMEEVRSFEEKQQLLVHLAELGANYGIKVYLCNEDRFLAGQSRLHPNLSSGVCAPPEDFALPDRNLSPSEGCGCVLMVDPFTTNESCSFGCQYCYAADKSLSPKKHNSTRGLPVIK